MCYSDYCIGFENVCEISKEYMGQEKVWMLQSYSIHSLFSID